jgi:hypothetical protein
MIRNDFLLRLIQQLAEVIGRALGLAKKGQTEEARRLLDEQLRAHVGMPWAMLDKLPPEEIARLLGAEKCMIIAVILDARADVENDPTLRMRANAIRSAAGLPT